MADKEQLYTNKIFLCGALPLLKTIVQDVPSLKKKFEKVHCVFQVSCRDSEAPDGKWATHFVVNGDEWLIHANKVAQRVDKQKYFACFDGIIYQISVVGPGWNISWCHPTFNTIFFE